MSCLRPWAMTCGRPITAEPAGFDWALLTHAAKAVSPSWRQMPGRCPELKPRLSISGMAMCGFIAAAVEAIRPAVAFGARWQQQGLCCRRRLRPGGMVLLHQAHVF